MREDSKTCTFGPDSQYAELAAEVFSLLADATRVRIILALREGERSVNELAEAIGRTPTTVSQHLAKLRWGRIVRSRQEGTRVYYSLVDEHARALVTEAVLQAQHALEDTPAHHRTAQGRIVAEGPAPSAGAAADAPREDPAPADAAPGSCPASGDGSGR